MEHRDKIQIKKHTEDVIRLTAMQYPSLKAERKEILERWDIKTIEKYNVKKLM